MNIYQPRLQVINLFAYVRSTQYTSVACLQLTLNHRTQVACLKEWLQGKLQGLADHIELSLLQTEFESLIV